jgi:hypothetical protein
METKDNVLTGYCFLAALTENQNDLFNHVFVPICKRALSLYSFRGATHGKASDIKNIILEEYGIDIPIQMVRKLTTASYKSFSSRSKKKTNFQIFENGNLFQIDKYGFSDLEEQYKRGERNAKALQEAFENFLKSEPETNGEECSFSDFLTRNKKQLSSFFKGKDSSLFFSIDKSFIHHVHFLEYIESKHDTLFEIAKSIFIGSIVASFLEAGLDLEPSFSSNEEYYLDTPIVLKALNLQKEDDAEAIAELLELIQKTGGRIKVLSITLDEISQVIEHAITHYNPNTPTTTINEACLRNGKNKAWLIQFNHNLREEVLVRLRATEEIITNQFIEKYQKYPDVKTLQGERFKKGNALHDVIAYLFVREARKSPVSLIQKAKAWFLSSNVDLLKFNQTHLPINSVPEIILPDALTSILWLKSPSKLLSKVKKIGLSELMASTLNKEIASKELIHEFEANIKKIDAISEEEYRILLESVAHQSARKIENFVEIANKDKAEARVEAIKIVEQERNRRAKEKIALKEVQEEKKREQEKRIELESSLAKIEFELQKTKLDSHEIKTEIEILIEQINQKEKSIKRTFKKFYISLPLLVIVALGVFFYDKLPMIGKVINWLSGLAWAYSLGNFLINLYKLNKGK